MNDKRRDNRNRVLRNGETQRSDGKYCYKYVDSFGNQKFIYSWKLTPTDRTPVGKRDGPCLRDKIAELEFKKSTLGLFYDSNITVAELTKEYVNNVTSKNINCTNTYNSQCKVIVSHPLTTKRIVDFTNSDAKKMLLDLYNEHHYAFSTINNIKRILSSVFILGIEKDLIVKNPFKFSVDKIIKNTGKKYIRVALTPEQKTSFINYVCNDKIYKKYYNIINLLFETGIRVSELCGLTADDVDLDEEKIFISKQLLAKPHIHISLLKTPASNRMIPLSDSAKKSFQQLMNVRKNTKKVDGVNNFLIQKRNNKPILSTDVEKMLTRVTSKYNKVTGENLYLTPHICRYTFCTNLIRKGINPKVLQKLMGHSNISTTLNIYTTLCYDDIFKEFYRLQNL